MKVYFEKSRDDSRQIYVSRNEKYVFPAHFHGNLEVCIVGRGEQDVVVNDTSYHLTDGSIAVMDSFDVHRYGDGDGEDRCVVIVPYAALTKCNARRKGLRIQCPVIRDEDACVQLLKIVDEYLLPPTSAAVREAATELFLATLFENLHFEPQPVRDEGTLVRKMLAFVQERFREDITRGDIARETGYSEGHISRVFRRYLGKSISCYINELRLEYIERERANDDGRTLTALIYDAGFQSQRTYYRAKAKYYAK